MAHHIDTTTGRAAAYFAETPAWHKLGTVVAEAQTSREAIGLAGLDWSVEKRATAAQMADGSWVTIPDTFATVRTDTQAVLGTVGSFYRPFQNAEAFDFLDAIVAEGVVKYESAGSLKGGRRVWMLARMPQEIRAAKDDVVHPYVLLTNSHDGTSGLRVIPTTVRVVCWNTLTLAMGRAGATEGLSLVHTGNLDQRIADARLKLGLVAKRMGQYGEQVAALTKRKLSQQELAGYFAKLVADRAEKQQKKLLESFSELLHNERNSLSGIKGTAWAAYNAASEWADHVMPVRGDSPEAKNDNRVNSIWFGSSQRFKAAAWETALALAS